MELAYAMKYADLYNSGLRASDIAKMLGLSLSGLSRRLKKWFNGGVLYKYYNVLVDVAVNLKTRAYVVSLNQRLPIYECIDMPRPMLMYYSPIPRPTYIAYYMARREEYPKINDVNTSICRIVVSGDIERVLQPIEHYSERKVEFTLSHRSVELDDVDEYIIRFFFSVFNPPVQGSISVNDIANLLARFIPPGVFRNHYYRHVYNRVVKKRILYREPGTSRYCVAIVYGRGIDAVIELLAELYSKRILLGIDQVNFVSSEPAIALVHVWVNLDIIWNHAYSHAKFEHAKYEIYPVKPVIQ